MAHGTARIARLYLNRILPGQTARDARDSQRPDLRKRATPVADTKHERAPDLVDLLADPSLIGTEWR